MITLVRSEHNGRVLVVAGVRRRFSFVGPLSQFQRFQVPRRARVLGSGTAAALALRVPLVKSHMPGLSGSGMRFNVHLPLVGRMSLNCTRSFVSEATLPNVEAKTFPVVSNSESKARVVPSYVFPSMVTGEKLEIKPGWLCR